ncbi:hypothetical protein RND81_08G174200 [Saponaria officinalis]|uniref:Uncharacterized protein n=1 Tax=Saponaria officinalis TaxID=3572 RepID=A0AAW1J8H9_SAPOF
MECEGVDKKANSNVNVLRLFGVDIPIPIPIPYDVSLQSDHSSTLTDERRRVSTSPKKRSKRKCPSSSPESSTKKPKKEKKPRPSREVIDRIGADGLTLPSEITQKIESLQNEQSRQDKKPRLLLQKILSPTDVDDSQSRLLFPRGQIKDHDFVNERERKTLHEDGQEGRVPVTVLYFDEGGEERMLIEKKANLGRWPKPLKKPTLETIAVANTSSVKWNYSLQTVWVAIMKASKLNEGDKVQVWSFRHGDDDECLGLVVRKVDV